MTMKIVILVKVFSESESQKESDLEDTSINFINEIAISTITSSSTNDSFHHHTTFSTVASTILEATPISSVAGASKLSNKKQKHTDKIANTATKSAVPDVQWKVINPDENDERLRHLRFCPSSQPGILIGLNENSTPLDCFSALFTDKEEADLIQMINDFAHYKIQLNTPCLRRSVCNSWVPVMQYDLIKMIALLIAMELDKRTYISDYWLTDEMKCIPWYFPLFSHERFQTIYQAMLHVSPSNSEKEEKIEPFLNNIISNFQKSFYPIQNVAIDEMVIHYKGRWKNKQYNPSKPSKYHIKTYGLCDSASGFTYNILTYFGSDTLYSIEMNDKGNSEKIFEYLLRPLGKWHHVFAVRFYTTHSLVSYLSSNSFYYTGTLNSNRKNFP